MKIKTKVKAGGINTLNHNQTAVGGLKVKSNVKATGLDSQNHNQAVASGLKVRCGVKAGLSLNYTKITY